MKNRPNTTSGSGNVFADLGLPNAEEHLLKAQVVSTLAATIKLRGLTQTAAAERMGIRQPDLSKLLRGHFTGFSLERLLEMLTKLGHNVTIDVTPANENEVGELTFAHA